MKYKLLVFIGAVFGVFALFQGSGSAATYPGYYGSSVSDSNYWCNVLGKVQAGYTQTQCVSQSTGVSHQDDAMTFLTSVCAANDSACLKTQLIQYVHDRLGSGSLDGELEHIGATYIVNTMRGVNNGKTIYPSGTNSAIYNDWVDRVNNPAVTLQLMSYTFTTNTAFDTFTNDVVQYPDSDTAMALAFFVSGTRTYVIKLDCGNPVGNLISLPNPPPPPAPPAPLPPPAVPTTKPYFDISGGDVAAGAAMETGAGDVCGATAPPASTNPDGGIVGWNRDGTPDFTGAGGQYGAFGMDFIQDFITGRGNGQQPANQETNQLTFANADYTNSVDLTQGYFGGLFEDAPCIDYWAGRPTVVSPPPNNNPASWPDGTYYVKADMTLQAGVIPAGRHITLYVGKDGAGGNNVAIAGNITYAPGPYGSRKDIPSFRLITHGVIFIGRNVTALDGLYAAIPDGGAPKKSLFNAPDPGTISTCSNGFSSYNPNNVPANNMSVDCNKPLTVTGSVAANQIWLLRTAGNLGTGTAAETFTYSPDIWLAPTGPSGGAAPAYMSVVGLPPVL